MGILERQRLAEAEPAQGRDPRVHPLRSRLSEDAEQEPAAGCHRALEHEPLYWIRARVERSQYERPPKLLAIRTNTVAVRQAETVRDEVLGGSNGRRDQVFRLANAPVLRDTLRLEIDEGSGPEIWTRVDDFFGSRPSGPALRAEPHHRRDPLRRRAQRQHPGRQPSNPEGNIVAREYRFGGGKQGNVPPARSRR